MPMPPQDNSQASAADTTQDPAAAVHPHLAVPHKPKPVEAVSPAPVAAPAVEPVAAPVAPTPVPVSPPASAPAPAVATPVTPAATAEMSFDQMIQTPPTGTVVEAPKTEEPKAVEVKEPAKVETATMPVPPPPPIALLSPEDEIIELQRELGELDAKKVVVESEMTALADARKKIDILLLPLMQLEKEYTDAIAAIDKRAAAAPSTAEKRTAEEERWKVEDLRQEVETSMWPHKQKLEKALTDIKSKELTHKTILEKQFAIVEHIHEVEVAGEKKTLTEALAKLKAEHTENEAKRDALVAEHNAASELLRATTQKETEAERGERNTDEALRDAHTTKDEQTLAAERHTLEVARREAEKVRWEAEDRLLKSETEMGTLDQKIKEIERSETEIIEQLSHLG